MEGAAADIPLVGRLAELDQIATLLTATDPTNSPLAVVLAGAPGVGKSRLAAEAGRAAEALGYVSTPISATQASASIPFAPFARFLPASAAAPEDLLGLLRHVREAVLQSAPAGKLLLLVDDAQLLDEGSATLVHQLVQGRECRVIATVRVPSQAPDTVTALWKDGLAVRIDLDPLSEAEVERFASAMVGGPMAGSAVRRLLESSGGNPLWLRELITGARRTGALVDDAGLWTLRQALSAPRRLAELVGGRFDGLAPDTALTVELLAAGEPLELTLLQACVPDSAIQDAERLGLVEVHGEARDAELRLTHPIYGEVLRQRLPRSRLRAHWAQLANALESSTTLHPTDMPKGDGLLRGDDLLRLVTWKLDGGLPGDPAQLSQAARRASQVSDKALAARLAEAAFAAGGGIEAGLALAVAQFSTGQHDEAEAVLAGLIPLCTTDGELARVTGARAYNLGTLLGRPDDAVSVIDDALRAVTDDSARLSLLGRMAITRVFQGDPVNTLQAAVELLECGDDGVISQGAYAAAIASSMLGRNADAVNLSTLGMQAHLRSPESRHQLPEVSLIGGVLGQAGAGELAASLANADRGYQACLAAGDKEGQATFSMLRGNALVAQGQLRPAALAFMEGASINRELRDFGALRWCLGGLAIAEGMAGRATAAAAAIAELNEQPSGWMNIFEPELVQRGQAWALAAGGELSAARAALEKAATFAIANECFGPAMVLLHDIARLGDPASVRSLVATATAQIDGPLALGVAAHVEALARRSGEQLLAASEQFEALGALLLAAEAGSAAAAALRAEGTLRTSSAAERQAAELLRRCGEITPPTMLTLPGAERLTSRESEIAGLAARGASSREIAAKLIVSVRTVENHLQNAYAKLGVTNRDELAAVLGERP